MHQLKLFFISLTLLLFSNLLHAIVYENAEDKSVKRWELLSPFKVGSISNIYDKKHKSYIIELDGVATQSAYILKLKSNTKLPPIKILQWEMNYSEDFVIMVDVSTKKGQRSLIYTPSEKGAYLQFGLGKNAISKNWKKFSRNLEDDLKRYEENNTIISLNNFIIRGSGRLDNIELLVNHIVKIPTKKPLKSKIKIKAIVKKEVTKKEDITLPIIKILGDNPILLNNGEQYIEAGATAKDVNGSNLSISISQNIDILKDGEYSVIYMTKNSIGNTAVDRRVVRVGKGLTKKSKIIIKDKSSEKEIREETVEEQPELTLPTTDEMEQELAKKILFERELLKLDRPEHPGL